MGFCFAASVEGDQHHVVPALEMAPFDIDVAEYVFYTQEYEDEPDD